MKPIAGGATETGVEQARDAIEGRTDRSSAERADHLAVLWFVAEAEDVPVRVMRAHISEDRLMESWLYTDIFKKGELRGELRGKAETIVGILANRMGTVDPAVRERVRSVSDPAVLSTWYQEALLVLDADGAHRLANEILDAPLA